MRTNDEKAKGNSEKTRNREERASKRGKQERER